MSSTPEDKKHYTSFTPDYTKWPDKVLGPLNYDTPLNLLLKDAASNFNEPSGNNAEKKIKGLTIVAAMGGGFVGVFEAFVKVAPSIFAVGGYFSRAVVTLGASGFMYGVGTQGTAVLRGKDDLFNYAVGGALAGLPMAKRYGNVWAGLGYALGFTTLGIFTRTLLVRPKGEFTTVMPQEDGSLYRRSYGYNFYHYNSFGRGKGT
ncbi:unnamed protein product [Mytilus coruscus]|uniref:NADH dehydrogenase [ubiquinone] 1 alpha subcomplex subunit 11 n=1 Tax=Mytilus coruscus TaxID=42192 RepID=A0A6J8B6M7_MYTCO|nr:unnamed protein product [Mytilus coruscus]